MNNERVIQIYDKIAEEYARRYDPIESEEDLVFLKTFLDHLKPGSYVADIGCGTGYSTGYFTKHGMSAEGIDLSSSMIAIAKRNYPEISFSVQDLRLWMPKKSVNAVWAGYCLFHLEQDDFEKTLANIRSYLKPGGVFGLVMQEGEGQLEADEPLLRGAKIYIHLYTEESLRQILERHGFTVVEVKRKKPMYAMEFAYNKLLIIAT
ncbi:class I SAM-dependent methyltransferase [Candidatus Uhrbacteria bacterium]|nr:class I SAM-dependent methyltransferase [Candidatus Uhrbacteria bacterium]